MLPPFNPDDYTHGSKTRVRWRGPAGHEWEATIHNRTKGSGCPVCARGAGGRARRQPAPGGSLADTHPEIAAEADGWDPSDYRPGSSARLPWQCSDVRTPMDEHRLPAHPATRLPGMRAGPPMTASLESLLARAEADLQAASNGAALCRITAKRRTGPLE